MDGLWDPPDYQGFHIFSFNIHSIISLNLKFIREITKCFMSFCYCFQQLKTLIAEMMDANVHFVLLMVIHCQITSLFTYLFMFVSCYKLLHWTCRCGRRSGCKWDKLHRGAKDFDKQSRHWHHWTWRWTYGLTESTRLHWWRVFKYVFYVLEKGDWFSWSINKEIKG